MEHSLAYEALLLVSPEVEISQDLLLFLIFSLVLSAAETPTLVGTRGEIKFCTLLDCEICSQLADSAAHWPQHSWLWRRNCGWIRCGGKQFPSQNTICLLTIPWSLARGDSLILQMLIVLIISYFDIGHFGFGCSPPAHYEHLEDSGHTLLSLVFLAPGTAWMLVGNLWDRTHLFFLVAWVKHWSSPFHRNGTGVPTEGTKDICTWNSWKLGWGCTLISLHSSLNSSAITVFASESCRR